MSKIIKSIFIPEENRNTVVKIPIPDSKELKEEPISHQLAGEPGGNPEQEAADVLAQAQEEAAALLAKARSEAETLKEEAKSSGYQEGFTMGQDQARQELAEAMAEFSQVTSGICEELAQERSRAFSGALEDLLKIVTLFAEKILRTTLDHEPEMVANLLAGALEKVDGVTRVEARLHPEDFNIIRQIDGEKTFGNTWTTLELVGDSKVPRYSCVVNTPRLSIDASLQTQLSELELALGKALQKEE